MLCDSFEVWCWRRVEKTIWILDRDERRNNKVLRIVKKKKKNVHSKMQLEQTLENGWTCPETPSRTTQFNYRGTIEGNITAK